jgi:putative membrane protein
MQIAMSKTREKYPLSKKKIIKKTIVSSIGLIFLMGVIFICSLSFLAFLQNAAILLIALIASVIMFVVLIGLVYYYQTWYFATYYYDFTDDYVIIRKGPLTPKEITIPYERIQDVYVDQDLFDRMLGLYDVHLSTATFSSGMSAHIDGVETAAADGLRTFLLGKVQERVGSKNK